eukprot:4392795-Prymnesium_polylepis.2
MLVVHPPTYAAVHSAHHRPDGRARTAQGRLLDERGPRRAPLGHSSPACVRTSHRARERSPAGVALRSVPTALLLCAQAGCNIHPPPKQYCAHRLAKSAMALEYGRDVAWRSPSFGSQRASASPPSVTVHLKDVSAAGLRDDQYPYNYLGGTFNCTQNAGKCAWAELQFVNG